MKAESNTSPIAPYDLEFHGETADIIFYENVVEAETEEGEPRYTYDTYRMTVRNRPTLISDLDSNIQTWLAAAKDAEFKALADIIRAKRTALLNETDYLVATDYPLPPDKLIAVQAYRQALRDLPEQDGFPYDLVFPKLQIK